MKLKCLQNLEMAEVLETQYYSIGQEPFIDLEDAEFRESLTGHQTGLSEYIVDPSISCYYENYNIKLLSKPIPQRFTIYKYIEHKFLIG